VADVQRGAPSIQPGQQQLPKGGASQVNAITPDAYPDIPVSFASAKDQIPDTPDETLSDNAQILVAPPNPQYASVLPRSVSNTVPDYVVRHLPRLMAAAKQDDAPATLKALYRNIIAQLDQQQSQG
jgi:uncharacterized protein YfaA (DUF2138 family)